jgi:hypothetical protein
MTRQDRRSAQVARRSDAGSILQFTTRAWLPGQMDDGCPCGCPCNQARVVRRHTQTPYDRVPGSDHMRLRLGARAPGSFPGTSRCRGRRPVHVSAAVFSAWFMLRGVAHGRRRLDAGTVDVSSPGAMPPRHPTTIPCIRLTAHDAYLEEHYADCPLAMIVV